MIFALLFLMLGPIKLLGIFAAVTKDCDRIFRLRLATRAFLFASAPVTIAAALGKQMLDNFAIPVLVLQIAAGLILFLVALQAVMQQYDVTYPPDRTEPPTLALAFSPLAFPTIVTPYGIAAVTILTALAPTTEISLMLTGGCLFHSVTGLARYARRTHRCPLVQPAAAAPRRGPRGHPGGARLTTHAWRYGRSDHVRRIYSPGKLTLGCDIPASSA